MIFKRTAAAFTAGLLTLFSVPAIPTSSADSSSADEIHASVIVDTIELTREEAEASPVQQVNIRVSGADRKYAVLGFHIHWDSSLKPELNSEGHIVTKGKALGGMVFEEYPYNNGVFITAFGTSDSGRDGIIASLNMKLPVLTDYEEDLKIWVTFESNEKAGDLFTNADDDAKGRQMQKWTSENGLVPGGIKVQGIPRSTTSTTTTTTTTSTTTTSSSATSKSTTSTTSTKLTTTTSTTSKMTTSTSTSTSSVTTSTTTTPPTPKLMIGDIDGNDLITAADASKLLIFYADNSGKELSLSKDILYVYDINRSGRIEAIDASLILAYYASASGSEVIPFEEFLKKRGITP